MHHGYTWRGREWTVLDLERKVIVILIWFFKFYFRRELEFTNFFLRCFGIFSFLFSAFSALTAFLWASFSS